MASMRASTLSVTTVRTRARLVATALALALAPPLPALASGPAKDELPTVTDDPTPPPGEDEVRNEPNLDRAMEAFQRGSQNYNEEKYQQALRDFLEAASLYASPDFQYNIGLCYEKLDKPEEAIAAFETYLKTKPEAADRANVEDRVERLRLMVEERKRGGGRKDPVDTKPAKKGSAARGILIAGEVLTGVGVVVALGGGIGFGVAAKRKSDALKDVQTGGNPDDVTLAEARKLESQGKKFEAIQIAMVAVGGALAVTGIALIAVGTVRRKNATKGKAARARLVPVLGARGAGLSLTGRF
jgi:tetratricopeptide (TPR) repeat protein